MSGKPGPYEGVVDKFSLPEEDLQGARAQELRNRRAAALCLRAAAMTESALDRQHLRRRAAQLISPDQGVGASAWPVEKRRRVIQDPRDQALGIKDLREIAAQ